ncbi:hypothetical protein C3747_241g6 [Trypanosoma cruzi]|uniref:Uncharacterized protein n=2 Tax=Trypanosoma cruzi TaxID=5693 RepID=Q4DDQ3_TRYCC|nr:hypothetical protein, conserved [Trypanosoma cruzi]EAN90652.1 hypothetical protein, conserved [Trypanosoma cruzi]PWU97604.1 hypothetical protein C3747_241g6 [Trypanosoma cruzi]|eukprot:XP_812503.1 hypothetical protein [Trypanosoma cruzi strain CL Brener]
MCDVQQRRVDRAPSARRLHGMITAKLLHRIRSNDPTLCTLRICPELITSPGMLDALLRNSTIRSVVFVNVTAKTVSEPLFAKFLACLYHLPLYTLLAGGNLRLPAHYMRHLLELVEYSCGVGKGCKWSSEENKATAVKGAASAADEVVNQATNSSTDDLKPMAKLEFVDLSGSHITDSHVMWLGRMIFHPRSSLRYVDLSECCLGTVGIRSLLLEELTLNSRLTAEVVDNTQLEVLDIRWNGITEDFALRVFLDSLEMNSSCTTCIRAHGNYISSELYQRLVDREASMLPIIEGKRQRRRQTRRTEAEELRRQLQQQQEEQQQQQQKQQVVSSSSGALGFLLSVASDSPSSLPCLCLLASLLHTQE